MALNELYLRTVFCCMACDGEIADEEVALLNKLVLTEQVFGDLDIQMSINNYIESINKLGKVFLEEYLEDVRNSYLDDSTSLQLVKIAIDTIEADNQVEYSEVSFFKRIRKQLSIKDEVILEAMPDKEDYLLPDVETEDIFDWSFSFQSIQLPELKA